MDKQLERVSLNLSQAIIEFWRLRKDGKANSGAVISTDFPQRFTANELRSFVNVQHFGTAPASADRVMRSLRKSGKINYALVNRAKSLYVALPLDIPAQAIDKSDWQ